MPINNVTTMLCEIYYVCDVIDDHQEWLSISYLFPIKLYV